MDIHTEKYDPYEPASFDGALVRVTEQVDPTSFVQTLVQPGNYYKIPISARSVQLISVQTNQMRQLCHKDGEYGMKIMNYSYSNLSKNSLSKIILAKTIFVISVQMNSIQILNKFNNETATVL